MPNNGLPKSFNKWNLQMPYKLEKRGLLLSVTGEIGAGKSDLIFRSAPEPVLFVNADKNVQGLVERYIGKQIYIHELDIPKDFDKASDKVLLDEFTDLYMDAVTSGYFRCISIDTFDHIYNLARRGILGESAFEFGENKRTDFAPVNAFMRSLFDEARKHQVSLIATSHPKDEYRGAVATGKKVPGGWKHMVACAEMHISLTKDISEKNINKKFRCLIEKCTPAPECEGEELGGDEITFQTLASLAYPGTDALWE